MSVNSLKRTNNFIERHTNSVDSMNLFELLITAQDNSEAINEFGKVIEKIYPRDIDKFHNFQKIKK
jgi:hypothetical protein